MVTRLNLVSWTWAQERQTTGIKMHENWILHQIGLILFSILELKQTVTVYPAFIHNFKEQDQWKSTPPVHQPGSCHQKETASINQQNKYDSGVSNERCTKGPNIWNPNMQKKMWPQELWKYMYVWFQDENDPYNFVPSYLCYTQKVTSMESEQLKAIKNLRSNKLWTLYLHKSQTKPSDRYNHACSNKWQQHTTEMFKQILIRNA